MIAQAQDFDVRSALEEEPDEKGGFADVYLFEDFVLKDVDSSEAVVNEAMELTSEISPETSYTTFEEDMVVIQERADKIYSPRNEIELQEFIHDTAYIVNFMSSRGFKLDFKPANFGQFSGETLYLDNTDLASALSPHYPAQAMANQLKHHLGLKDYYSGPIPSTEEITTYWENLDL